jgi:NAD(P)-dependent dehydrogenase (short-subunit alcohol dehydrogenase family)
MGQLDGKIALVTGATSGIGKAIAVRCVQEGARVMLTGRSAERGQAVCDALNATGGRAYFKVADVTREADVLAVVQATIERCGGLDILVNGAGISPSGRVTDTSLQDWQRTLDIDLTSIFLTSKSSLPHMMAQRQGVILNILGTLAMRAVRDKAAYCAAKAGALNLTFQMALDYGDYGIRVNAICPGFIDTPLNHQLTPELLTTIVESQPLHRTGQADDVAGAAVYLASEAASYVTGAALAVDGGQSASMGALSAVDYWARKTAGGRE